MKKIIIIVFLVVVSVFFLSSCNEARKKTLERVLGTESGDYENEKVSEERIKELEVGIAEFYNDVERVVKANAEIGIYYRMLALEYMDLEMYHYALENLEKSMEFYPTNPVLSHYAGLAKANIARAEISENDRVSMLHEAETYYLTAVRLRRDYSNAMYALSVLYMFDLSMPEKAAPLLEEMIFKDPQNWEAKFLYARFKVVSGDVDSAIDLYNELSEEAWDDEMKEQAGRNRDSLLAGQL